MAMQCGSARQHVRTIFFSRSRSRTCSLHFQNGPWCLTKPTVYLTRPLFRSFRRLCFASRHSLTIAIDIECVSTVVDQSFWIINLDVDESSYTDEVITCSEHELTHWHVCAEWAHSDHFVTQLSSSNCCCFGRVAMCNMRRGLLLPMFRTLPACLLDTLQNGWTGRRAAWDVWTRVAPRNHVLYRARISHEEALWGHTWACPGMLAVSGHTRRYSLNNKTRCRAKPNVSPPGCATSLLRPANQFCG